jgi:hypothetical protein
VDLPINLDSTDPSNEFTGKLRGSGDGAELERQDPLLVRPGTFPPVEKSSLLITIRDILSGNGPLAVVFAKMVPIIEG